ncbi:MAG: SIS domain-containing protein [Candidatus Tectomicrobia bacterium]|nr:SIS domain-containing protein [Candidatus Tectomicrobia bacterium]
MSAKRSRPARPEARKAVDLSAREVLADRARCFEAASVGEYPRQVEALASAALACLRGGGKILVFGNGGSASLAQHFAGELVGRFLKDRRPLPALSLAAEAAALTAIANDFSYERVFPRQLEALARPGDLALGLSTSGKSPNVIAALERARQLGLKTAVLSGKGGGPAARVAEIAAIVPSDDTGFIQEAHEAALHYLCHLADAAFPEGGAK